VGAACCRLQVAVWRVLGWGVWWGCWCGERERREARELGPGWLGERSLSLEGVRSSLALPLSLRVALWVSGDLRRCPRLVESSLSLEGVRSSLALPLSLREALWLSGDLRRWPRLVERPRSGDPCRWLRLVDRSRVGEDLLLRDDGRSLLVLGPAWSW
jgi:hypothetical protein